jgi:hypothetical protein
MRAPTLKIQLEADALKIVGPKVDGSLSLSFSVGAHQQLEVAKLLTIPQQTILNVTVEVSQ